MVEFEEIKDEHYQNGGDGVVNDDEASDDDYSDTSSAHEDEDIADESILDRIVALKDIIPEQRRLALSRAISQTVSYGSMATYIGGKAVYIAITSILMLGIPYALAVEEEKAISEQERQMQMQQGMSEVCFTLNCAMLICR